VGTSKDLINNIPFQKAILELRKIQTYKDLGMIRVKKLEIRREFQVADATIKEYLSAVNAKILDMIDGEIEKLQCPRRLKKETENKKLLDYLCRKIIIIQEELEKVNWIANELHYPIPKEEEIIKSEIKNLAS